MPRTTTRSDRPSKHKAPDHNFYCPGAMPLNNKTMIISLKKSSTYGDDLTLNGVSDTLALKVELVKDSATSDSPFPIASRNDTHSSLFYSMNRGSDSHWIYACLESNSSVISTGGLCGPS
ncbi:hypothetical protein NPIL_564331 [Nephila pilipes]|uniref:Uncharacterized protein n=1 Tax=Nephila pilipes TaxID=299642 RepID=A0A8X6PPQ9_NEPPI|nr:hypothetical protein NPIL_564331 [Nephila pilipes]